MANSTRKGEFYLFSIKALQKDGRHTKREFALSNSNNKDQFRDFLMMIKQIGTKNSTWNDVLKLKYVQIRAENSFWCPPAFQLKNFVKPIGNHYAQD